MNEIVTRYCVTRWETQGVEALQGRITDWQSFEVEGADRLWVGGGHHFATREEANAAVRKRAAKLISGMTMRITRAKRIIKELGK